MKGEHLLIAKQADGTVVSGIPVAANWVEENFDKKVLAAVQKAFFSALRKWDVVEFDHERKRQ